MQARAEILAVGLHHRIVTAYTSLVAVDSASRVSGPQATIVQPVELVDGMHGANQIPAGGTSRDFTAVLDLSPTASRDVGGIRLSGTSGATTQYIVSGVSSRPGTPVPEQAARASSPGPARGARVEVHAHARLRSLSGAVGPTGATRRRELGAGMEQLAMCFGAAPRSSYRVLRHVTLRVDFDVDGRVERVEVSGAGTEDARLQQCLRERLETIFVKRTPMTFLAIKLGVSMQF